VAGPSAIDIIKKLSQLLCTQ